MYDGHILKLLNKYPDRSLNDIRKLFSIHLGLTQDKTILGLQVKKLSKALIKYCEAETPLFETLNSIETFDLFRHKYIGGLDSPRQYIKDIFSKEDIEKAKHTERPDIYLALEALSFLDSFYAYLRNFS